MTSLLHPVFFRSFSMKKGLAISRICLQIWISSLRANASLRVHVLTPPPSKWTIWPGWSVVNDTIGCVCAWIWRNLLLRLQSFVHWTFYLQLPRHSVTLPNAFTITFCHLHRWNKTNLCIISLNGILDWLRRTVACMYVMVFTQERHSWQPSNDSLQASVQIWIGRYFCCVYNPWVLYWLDGSVGPHRRATVPRGWTKGCSILWIWHGLHFLGTYFS